MTLGTSMVLGFLVSGMFVGAMAASYWVVTGGSFLVAFALYSLVATAIVISAAMAAFFWSERKARLEGEKFSGIPAAE